MKRIISILVLIAIVTLSCKKDDPTEPVIVDDYTVTVDGNELNNGDVWEASGANVDGNMILLLTNTSSNSIGFKMKIISIEGDIIGQNIEFCIETCYTADNIETRGEGAAYPSGESFYSLQAGQNSGSLVHIKNGDSRNESYSFLIKLYQTDENGVELVSKKSVQFTYKYVKA